MESPRYTTLGFRELHHTTYCRRRKSLKSESNRSRVDVTELKYTVPRLNLKEMKVHVRIIRGTEKAVWKGAMYISQEAIPNQMDTRNITYDGRSFLCNV